MDEYADENITYLEFHLIRSSRWMMMWMKYYGFVIPSNQAWVQHSAKRPGSGEAQMAASSQLSCKRETESEVRNCGSTESDMVGQEQRPPQRR